jgi:hypothetical protein
MGREVVDCRMASKVLQAAFAAVREAMCKDDRER